MDEVVENDVISSLGKLICKVWGSRTRGTGLYRAGLGVFRWYIYHFISSHHLISYKTINLQAPQEVDVRYCSINNHGTETPRAPGSGLNEWPSLWNQLKLGRGRQCCKRKSLAQQDHVWCDSTPWRTSGFASWHRAKQVQCSN